MPNHVSRRPQPILVNLRSCRFVATAVLAIAISAMLAGCRGSSGVALELTILHNNDAESLLVGFDGVGGVDRFATVLNRERELARAEGRGVVFLSSGDNFLAGRQLDASLATAPGENASDDELNNWIFYDAEAIRRLAYDALVIGNHDLDFGPGMMSKFIRNSTVGPGGVIENRTPFISANLDMRPEPLVTEFARSLIKPSVVIDVPHRGGVTRVGVIGATTPMIRRVASPGRIGIDSDVAGAVQREIDRLTADGVRIIIFVSHLQTIEEDRELLATLRGIDVAIAGGGDELLVNAGTPLAPADQRDSTGDGWPDAVYAPYPMIATDADGRLVPVVTTSGAYTYLGKLTVRFDAKGNLLNWDGAEIGPIRVVSPEHGADGVEPDPAFTRDIVSPVAEFIADLDTKIIGQTGPVTILDGRREAVRHHESGMGNLLADALLWQARRSFSGFGVGRPAVALTNGGGIRNDIVINPNAPITAGALYDAFPFSNFVAWIPGVEAEVLRLAMENAVCRVEFGDGRFAQIAGMRVEFDSSRPGRLVSEGGEVLEPGSRVRTITLDDGTPVVRDGRVVDPTLRIDVASLGFVASGGDFYAWTRDPRKPVSDEMTQSGVVYRQAVMNFIEEDLDGVVDRPDYAEKGAGRLVDLR